MVATHEASGAGARLITGCFLMLLILGVSVVKVQANRSLARQYGSELIGFYPSECAVQYRYARLIAEGMPLPRRDEKLQYPEGVDTYRELTVFMEVVSGHAYRIARRLGATLTLDEFLYWWCSFFSSLSVIPAYLLARRVFHSRLAGIAACLLYALSTASADRTIRSYLYETFALPLLFGGTACFVASMYRVRSARSWMSAGFAALLLVTGLASWHFSRFYFLVLGVAAAALFLTISPRRLPRLLRAVAVITLLAGLAGVFVPVLQAKRFWASPQLMVWMAIVVAAWLELQRQGSRVESTAAERADPRRIIVRRLARLAIVAIPLFIISASQRTESEGYGHVWGLLWEKLRHFGWKPVDPAELSYEARALWTGAFNSPSAAYVLTSFWAIVPACAVAARRQYRSGRGFSARRRVFAQSDLILLVVLALLFGGLFWLIKRLSVFAVFFLAVVGGGCVYRLRTKNRWAVAIALLACTSALCVDFLSILYGSPIRVRLFRALGGPNYRAPVRSPEHDDRLVKWARRNTPVDAVFLARLGINPLMLAYADRAVVLQPKFEHDAVRDKWREFLAALYGDESALARFCEQYRVTHYLYDVRTTLDAGTESERYAAVATRLPSSTPAYLMHFAPQQLQHFQLVYQNAFYRVFEFVPHRDLDLTTNFDYQPLYDLRRFGPQTGHEPFFDDSFTQRFLRNQEVLDRGWLLFTNRRPVQALGCFDEVLANDASFPGAHTGRGLALAMMGRQAEGLSEGTKETQLYPNWASAFYYLAFMHQMAANHTEAMAALERCQQLDPDYPSLDKAIEAVRRRRAADP
jgi:tetratricopeptide (TPR) repeat protein